MLICLSSFSGCCSNVFSLGQIDGHIGADSMGAMGAIAPTAKKLWG